MDKLEITFMPQLTFRSRPRKSVKPDRVTSGSDAMTNDPLPWHWPVNGEHDTEETHLVFDEFYEILP